MKEVEENLLEAHRNIILNKGNPKVRIHYWMDRFMNTGDGLEHEAFLVLWLSWFVFPLKHPLIGKFVFPLAIRLGRGIHLAFAPAVLASIYRDLTLLKKLMVSWLGGECSSSEKVKINLYAPLQYVQIWAWERFPAIGPFPHPISIEKQRMARWHDLNLKRLKVEDLRMALDFARECFQWRPYCAFGDNWRCNMFYREKEAWVVIGSGINEEIATFVMFVRPSELVGLDFQEQYLPHRVAMQFGLDQDIPDFVPRFNDNFESAWSNYMRPIGDTKLYIPARLFESDVTLRYSTWWDQAMVAEDRIKSFVRKSRSKSRKRVPRLRWGFNADDKAIVLVEDDDFDNLTITEVIKKPKVNGTNSSSPVDEKELKTDREVALEARVRQLEGLVVELTTERLSLLEELRSSQRLVNHSCMV